MLGGNLPRTSIASRGSRNTPSRFILQKPEISAGNDEPTDDDPIGDLKIIDLKMIDLKK